jgi:DNA invertase Pin-like site-specific DNA recombinase
MTDIGYARVSTTGQDLALQIDALTAAGVQEAHIYTDTASGKLSERPGLARALSSLHQGDTLVVWKLDRLGRSLRHLVDTVDGLAARGVQFRSLTEGMDTTTNGGRFIFHIFAGLAQFERGLIRERTEAGLAAARAQGHYGGRRPALTPEAEEQARSMHRQGVPIARVARVLGVSRPTIYRAIEGQHSPAAAAASP